MTKDLQLKQQMDALARQSADADADAEHQPEVARRASHGAIAREVGSMQAVAQRGVRGGGGALPFREQIQASFGRHDVSGIQAHTGGEAEHASREMGAQAFATGNDVAFAQAPDLHTAAHEAAHVVQQRGGVQLKGGVGAAGDVHERNADEVADRVVAGKSAEDLLGAPSARGGARAEGGAVQMKAEKKDEHAAPTPEEKAAAGKTSDNDSRAAISASILLLAKNMHGAVASFNALRTVDAGERTNAPVDAFIAVMRSVYKETDELLKMLKGAKIPAAIQGNMFPELLQLEGARSAVARHKALMDSFVDRVLAKEHKDFERDLDSIFHETGDQSVSRQPTAEESAAKPAALMNSAIKAHLLAARDAAISSESGNAHIERLNAHVRHVHDLVPLGERHALRAFKKEVEDLRHAAEHLEQAHPDNAADLKKTDGIIKQLVNLSK